MTDGTQIQVAIGHPLSELPQQNPLTRIRQVAEDLGRLGDEIESSVGPEAKAALDHWRTALLDAIDELQRQTVPPAQG